MSNMDKKQEAFFKLAHGLASAFDACSNVGRIIFEVEMRAVDVREGKKTPEIFALPEFVDLMKTTVNAQGRAVMNIAEVLAIIVRNAEAAGVVDSEFARNFLGKFEYALPDNDEDKSEGFGGRFSAN